MKRSNQTLRLPFGFRAKSRAQSLRHLARPLRSRNTFQPRLEALEERQVLTALSGFVFEDVNANLVRDDGDLRIAGVEVYIDANDNGQLDQAGFGLDPDTYNTGEILNNSNQLVFPSSTGVDNEPAGRIRAVASRVTPTGDLVFGQDDDSTWTNENRLRFDFTLPIDSVSLDVAGASGDFVTAVQLDAYSEAGVLLGSDTATDLVVGDVERLTITRAEKDVKYVVAHVVGNRALAIFDNLRADNTTDELSTLTSRLGAFSFFDLPEESFVLRQITPEGYEQVVPEDSFTTPISDAVVGIDFLNRTSSIGGIIFTDEGTRGVYEPGVDPAIPGAALYLDMNENGMPDSRVTTVNPGAFLPGQPLEYVSDDVRVTTANSSNAITGSTVIANDDDAVSLDGQIFTRDIEEANWTTDERLRVDFHSPASEVKLEFIAAREDAPEQGIMVAYSSTGQEIATTTTQLLAKGQRQSLVISRPDFAISYVVAYTVASEDAQGRLDNLEATIVDEPVAIADVEGEYLFKPLPDGDYRVGTLPISGQMVTTPSDDDVQQISLEDGEDELDINFGLQSENDPPLARADVAETVEESSISIGVLVNDFDPDGSINEGSIEITQQPSNGTATVTANGFINYAPNENFEGTDTLIYTVRDDKAALSNSGVVTINVTGINDPPITNNETVALRFGQTNSTIINVLRNDFDVDGNLNTASVEIVDQPSSGTVTVDETGTITYTSTLLGTDTFSYVVSDNEELVSAPAMVTITSLVGGIAPVAVDDSAATLEGTRREIDVTANDTDADGTIQSELIAIVDPPTTGSVAIRDGKIEYTPALGFIGEETFRYQVRDNDLLASNAGLVTVTMSERDFPYQNPVNPLDVSPDGFVIPRDALIIINEINARRFSDATTGQILTAPDPGSPPAAYYDVNGDGFVAALDVLRVINAINAQGNAEPPAQVASQADAVAAQAAVAAAFSTDFDVFEDDEDEA